jgi:AbrB family looped-hinge helix DNA binding protein
MATVRLSTKGQLVLPADMRQRYGLEAGSVLSIGEDEGVLCLIPAPRDPVVSFRGLLKGGPSLTEGLLEERALDKEREERKFARFTE